MNVTWLELIASLRAQEGSDIFQSLVDEIGEAPDIAETPLEYNDPEGKTTFYKFLNSGIEIGFRKQVLNHIHLYVMPGEGYRAYLGSLASGIERHADEGAVRAVLGSPSSSGGGKASALLGFRRKWIKFNSTNYAERYEFDPENGISKVTLIAE